MDIEQARDNMITRQIRCWEVLDQGVLDLLKETHREDFIPDEFKYLAFADTCIPIGHNQTTMTPAVEARLLQALAIKPDESVLEIGTGCGYLSCLLAKSARQVKSIDIFPEFTETAKQAIARTGAGNIELECRDAFAVNEKSGTYDVIVFTASLPGIDDRFTGLLNANGRMFAVIGKSPGMEACIITKQAEHSWSKTSLFETDLPALIGSNKKQVFTF